MLSQRQLLYQDVMSTLSPRKANLFGETNLIVVFQIILFVYFETGDYKLVEKKT